MATPLEDIKSRIDIAQYIGQYVKLAPSGKSLRGLCPLHKEKTPSFFVSPERQAWYCFGCQKGGDLFKFVMEYEKLEFPEALRLLAEKAGVAIAREDPRIHSLRTNALEALAQAQKWYAEQFGRNALVRRYAESRGLNQGTIQEFGVGFAPQGWQNIVSFLKTKGFSPQDMEQAGLIIRRTTNDERPTANAGGSGYYDRFRARLMFPIFDHMGRIVGFSGRILPPEFGGPQDQTQEAKYINTPDTLVYQKGEVLYGFHKTKDAIRDGGSAVLVEGNMDMLMGWQAGIRNIVAASGTGLTDAQLRMLRRSCANLILNFDMDRAGEMATDRSIGLALKHGFSVKILTLPDGKDLADFVRAHPDAAGTLAGRAQESMAYYFDNAFRKSGGADGAPDIGIEAKKLALAYLLPRLKLLQHPVDRHAWIEALSRKVQISEQALEDELKRTQTLLDIVNDSEEDRTAQRIEHLFMKSRLDALAERAFGLALKTPEDAALLEAVLGFFPNRFKEFGRSLCRMLASGDQDESIDQESMNYLALRADYELALLPEKTSASAELRLTLEELKQESVRARLREISVSLKEAEQARNTERVAACTKEMYALTRELTDIEAKRRESDPFSS